MPLKLKVVLPFGCDEKEKVFNFEGSELVRDAVCKVVTDQKLTSPDLRTFYNPSTSTHCNPDSTMSDCKFNEQEPVQLSFKYVLVPTVFSFDGDFRLKTLAYPLFAPLSNWIPYVAHKFGLDNTDGYAFKFIGSQDDLSPSMSLFEQKYTSKSQVLVYEINKRLDITSMKIFLDIQDKQHNRGTKQKTETFDFNDDLLSSDIDLEAPAGSLLVSFPKLSGYLSTLNKKKKWDRWFCILIAGHLFFYKSQNDPKPLKVLNLVQYKVSHLDDKKKKVAQGFLEIAKENGKESATYKADTAQWHKQWLENLQKVCEEAREERDKKIAEKEAGISTEGVGKVFCCPLEQQVEKTDGSELPEIVPKCIEYIEERALDVEGIFRLSGSAVLIQEYKQKFDNGEDVSFENESDPHAVAGLFKLYFRELPAPVMTWEHYDDFIIAESITNEGLRLRYLRYLIDNKIPAISRALLRRLVSFLRRVNEHSEVNKMPIHNIATVFGPNLLRQKNANMLQMVEDTAQINNIVNILINYDGYLLNDRPMPEDIDEDQLVGTYAKALYDYVPENAANDLTFKKNDMISVILQGIDGWWKGELNGDFGKFPGSYVQVLQGDELKKNMRRVRFKQEMVRLRKQDADEAKTLERLQKEKEELLEAQNDLNAQWEKLETVFSSLSSQLVSICGKETCQSFASKLKHVSDTSLAYNLVHDDVSDCRYDLVNQLEDLKTMCTPTDKDKKKKTDKKQEKMQENIRKLLEPIAEQFKEEQSLHRKNVKLGADVVQSIQAIDQVGYFLQQG
mmetsp:Transcript_11826/g.20239  ORF Transcript_11826/g.20239 Transcript_11826/m.20239 type:complete len:788 (+) Transcript_11826:52-2415(+)